MIIFEQYTLEELMLVLDYVNEYSINYKAPVFTELQRDYLINMCGSEVYYNITWDEVAHEEWFKENMGLPLVWMEECYGPIENYYELLHMYTKFAVDNQLTFEELFNLADALENYYAFGTLSAHKFNKVWRPLISVLPTLNLALKALA